VVAGAAGGGVGRGVGPSAAGAPAAAAGTGSGNVGWWILGGAFLIAVALVAYPIVSGQGSGVRTPAAATAGGGASAVDLSAMTPRQAADALYDRVMRMLSAGDTAGAVGFLPMSISAYDIARPLDEDGLFHLALLQVTGGDAEGSLATAREALADSPNHLLNLAVAGRAAALLGDGVTAGQYYETLLAVWDVELARGLEEYGMHERMMADLRAEAETFLGGG
jgi:hypothetical protein